MDKCMQRIILMNPSLTMYICMRHRCQAIVSRIDLMKIKIIIEQRGIGRTIECMSEQSTAPPPTVGNKHPHLTSLHCEMLQRKGGRGRFVNIEQSNIFQHHTLAALRFDSSSYHTVPCYLSIIIKQCPAQEYAYLRCFIVYDASVFIFMHERT